MACGKSMDELRELADDFNDDGYPIADAIGTLLTLYANMIETDYLS